MADAGPGLYAPPDRGTRTADAPAAFMQKPGVGEVLCVRRLIFSAGGEVTEVV